MIVTLLKSSYQQRRKRADRYVFSHQSIIFSRDVDTDLSQMRIICVSY